MYYATHDQPTQFLSPSGIAALNLYYLDSNEYMKLDNVCGTKIIEACVVQTDKEKYLDHTSSATIY